MPTPAAWQVHRGREAPFSSAIEITAENTVMTLHLRAGLQALKPAVIQPVATVGA
jgi:hypothetical protein